MIDPEPLTEEDHLAIVESMNEIRDGKYYTLKDTKSELDIS